MTWLDVLLLAAILTGCVFAARKIYRDKKRGFCCGNCSSCGTPCQNKKEVSHE